MCIVKSVMWNKIMSGSKYLFLELLGWVTRGMVTGVLVHGGQGQFGQCHFGRGHLGKGPYDALGHLGPLVLG